MTHAWRRPIKSYSALVQKRQYKEFWERLLSGVNGHSSHGRAFTSERSEARSEGASLSVPTFMVWGANTGVGKTLVSAALARDATLQEV